MKKRRRELRSGKPQETPANHRQLSHCKHSILVTFPKLVSYLSKSEDDHHTKSDEGAYTGVECHPPGRGGYFADVDLIGNQRFVVK